jgi:23S rRNA (uracil1939-C5)-methyltransferase
MTQIEFTPSGYAYGGDAFGRDADGKMIFVPFAVPGERIKVELTQVHDRWAKGKLVEILERSGSRITPRCKHYQLCGGCHYQHIPYDLQPEMKSQILAEQLQRIGKIDNPAVAPPVWSSLAWEYRNNIRFHAAPAGGLGFFTADQGEIFPATECHLPLPELKDLWGRLDLPPELSARQVSLRAGSDDDRLVILHGDGPPQVETASDTADSLVWLSEAGTFVLAGDAHLLMRVFDRVFRVSASSFFQVNTAILETLVELVLALAQPAPGELVFDLYAGVGLFSSFFATSGASVIAIEESPAACGDLEFNLQDCDDVTLYESPVEIALPAIGTRPDTIVLDPPRSGIGARVVDQLARFSPRKIVYISCDPATLARDGKRLGEHGYSLQSITPVDMFPQTYHIESVSEWRKG